MEALNYYNEDTILIVDDESDLLDVFSEVLSRQNYTVLTVNSADQALSIMAARHVDIVISDEKMPGMSGNELLGIIRRKYPDTVPMMITGYADTQTVMRAINDGQVYRFFTKPVIMSDLISSIDQALEHQKCIKEVNRLRRKVADQQNHIAKLEKTYPGISQLKRDSSGAIIIENE